MKQKIWVPTCFCHSPRGGLWLNEGEEMPNCSLDGGPIIEYSFWNDVIEYYLYAIVQRLTL